MGRWPSKVGAPASSPKARLEARAPTCQDSRSRLPQSVEAEKTQLVPVAALEGDLALDDLKEAAAAQALGITPFENRPVAILEDVLGNADHLRLGKALGKHGPNGLAADHRLIGDLV